MPTNGSDRLWTTRPRNDPQRADIAHTATPNGPSAGTGIRRVTLRFPELFLSFAPVNAVGNIVPYYDEGGITIYNADCRDVLPAIDPATRTWAPALWRKPAPTSDGYNVGVELVEDYCRIAVDRLRQGTLMFEEGA